MNFVNFRYFCSIYFHARKDDFFDFMSISTQFISLVIL